jgi:hypothetical protein
MPATPLTIDCRAAANRMAQISNIGGNTQMIHKLVYEDSRKLYDLMAFLLAMGNDAPDESGPGGYYSVTLAQKRVSSVMEGEGNLQLHPLLIASSLDVIAACDFADAAPSPPVLLGSIVAAQTQAAPLVMLTAAGQPLNPLAVSGSKVRVEESQWLSINDQTFLITVVDRPLAQFNLNGADTTDETMATVGGSVWLIAP